MSVAIKEKIIPLNTYTEDQIDLIKRTVCKGASNDELELFLYTCQRTGLDPLMKQIHAVKRGNTMTLQTSIDGFRAIAERTRRYAPGSPTKFEYKPDGSLLSATAFVKKLTDDGTWHEVPYTAFFDEFAQEFNGRLSQFWKKMPHVMLAKCAESGALRKAFPYEMNKLYTHEEMANGLNVQDANEAIELKALEKEQEAELDIPTFSLPDGIEQEEVEAFFLHLGEIYKSKTLPQLKQAAAQNLEGFWEKFNEWKANTNT